MPAEDEYKSILFAEIEKEVEKAPGIYQIWTKSGNGLKVGISKNLKKRLKQHAASRDCVEAVSNPTEPAHLRSRNSILAKHLYFDRTLTVKEDYDLTEKTGRETYLAHECYIMSRVTKTRDEARELEKTLEQSGKFRYVRKVRIIEKS